MANSPFGIWAQAEMPLFLLMRSVWIDFMQSEFALVILHDLLIFALVILQVISKFALVILQVRC